MLPPKTRIPFTHRLLNSRTPPMSLHPREAVDERRASRASKEWACRVGRGSDLARPWPQKGALAQAVDRPPKEVREEREKAIHHD